MIGLGVGLDAVIELVVDNEVLFDRLRDRARSQGRADDSAPVVRRRQQVYDEQTAPLTAHYSGCGLLQIVDGEGPVEVVTTRVTQVLAEALAKASS